MSTERLHWRNDIDYLEKRLERESAEVTRLKDELAKAQAELQFIDSILARRPALADLTNRAAKIEHACAVAGKATDEAAKLQVQCAAMREVLIQSVFWLTEVSKACADIVEWDQIDADEVNKALNNSTKALSTTAGADLLAKLERYEGALVQIRDFKDEWSKAEMAGEAEEALNGGAK